MGKLRFRKKYNRKRKIGILCILIMSIGLGFAAINATLGISASTTIGKITFDVHFENLRVLEGSMEAVTPATISDDDNRNINFDLEFKIPGEHYEFIADIVNSGTLDAKVADVVIAGLTEDQNKYIKIAYEYFDGIEVKKNDLIRVGETDRIRVRVDFLSDINIEDLPSISESLKFSLNTIFVQDDTQGVERARTIWAKLFGSNQGKDNKNSKYVMNATGIDFSSAASDKNGKGLYLRSGTENDKYPIYYYRGDIDNNNIIFGGFCWKIVRTTEKGGTKLIYNGLPNRNNECNNTGLNSQLSVKSEFNSNDNSLADVGYMYGTRYRYTTWTMSEYVYGSDVNYDGENYELINTSTGIIQDIRTKHYTCKLTNDGNCNIVYYVYSFSNNKAYALALTNGKKIEDIINDSFDNRNDSKIKETIDTWFEENLLNKESYLEDAVWCNDRSIASGGFLDEGDATENDGQTYFGALGARHLSDSKLTPSLKDEITCPNKNDRFTKNDINIGNGNLKYSVGLLTVDEVIIAGNGYNENNNTAYLYTGQDYWLLSPNYTARNGYGSGGSRVTLFGSIATGYMGVDDLHYSFGVRPSIVLKYGTILHSGDGTATNPYVVDSYVEI